MKKIFRLSSIIMIGDISSRALSILYLVPLAMINDSIAALISTLIIPFAFFIVVSNMGLSTIMSVNIIKYHKTDPSRAKTNVIIGSIALLISSIICTFIMYFGAQYFVDETLIGGNLNPAYYDMIMATKYMSIGILIYGILSLTRTLLLSMGEYTIISIGYFLEQLIKIIIVLLMTYIFIYLGDVEYFKIVYFTVIGTLFAMLIVIFINALKIIKHKYYMVYFDGTSMITRVAIKTLLLSSVIFIASSFYISAFDMIDLMFADSILQHVGYSFDASELFYNEYFGFSKKIVMIPIQLTDSFIFVMIKELENSTNKKKEFNNVILLTITLSLIAMSGILVVGPNLYMVLAGTPSLGILQVQAMIIVFYTTKNIMSAYFLTFDGFEKALINSMIVIVVVKILTLLLLANIFVQNIFVVSSVISLLFGIIVLVYSGRKFLSFDYELYRQVLINFIKVLVITVVFYIININVFLDSALLSLFVIGTLMLITLIIVLIPRQELKNMISRRNA